MSPTLAIGDHELAMNAANSLSVGRSRRPSCHLPPRRGLLIVTVSDDGEGPSAKDFAAGQPKGLGMSIVQAIVRPADGRWRPKRPPARASHQNIPPCRFLPRGGAESLPLFAPPEPTEA